MSSSLKGACPLSPWVVYERTSLKAAAPLGRQKLLACMYGHLVCLSQKRTEKTPDLCFGVEDALSCPPRSPFFSKVATPSQKSKPTAEAIKGRFKGPMIK